MSDAPVRELEPLSFGGFRPHEGCPRRGWPGGQVALVRAALANPFVTALWGRDTGKSVAAEVLYWEEARMTQGVYEFIYVAQGHPQAERTFEKFVYVCEKAGKGFLVDRKNKGQDRWVRTRQFGNNSGTVRHFWSGEPGALTNVRGPRGNRLVVDEAGMVHKDVLTTCIPMLGTRNGKSLFIGTASRGGCGFVWFKGMFDRGGVMPGYVSFNFPKESNPYLSDEAIMRERMLFRNPSEPDVKTAEEMEECDGAFVSDLGAFFRNIDAVMSVDALRGDDGLWTSRDDVHPRDGCTYVIGQDFGKKLDHSVSSVFCRQTRSQVALRIEPVGMKYGPQLERLDALKRRYNDAFIVCDARDAANRMIEELQAKYGDRVKPIAFTGEGPNGKGAHAHRIRDYFDNETWKLLKVPEQVKQFSDFHQVPIGDHANGYRYEGPAGTHDDCVTAAMFASSVLRFDAPVARIVKPKEEPMSVAWYERRAKERRVGRRRSFGGFR